MHTINLSKRIIIDGRIFTEFSVKFYGIHYDDNCVVASVWVVVNFCNPHHKC